MRANRCGERTRHFARRTPDHPPVDIVRGDGGGNRYGSSGFGDGGRDGRGNCGNARGPRMPGPETGAAAIEQHFVGSGQAARAGTHARPAEQAHAAAAAAADQFQVSGGVADHVRGWLGRVHVSQELGVVVDRQPAQPQGIADHRHVSRPVGDGSKRRLRQTADARTAGRAAVPTAGYRGRRGRIGHQAGTAGNAAPGTSEETESTTGAVHASAAAATFATDARPAAAEEDGQRGQPVAENGPVHERGRSHIGFAHPAGRRGAVVRRRRREAATRRGRRHGEQDGGHDVEQYGHRDDYRQQSVRDGHNLTHDGCLNRYDEQRGCISAHVSVQGTQPSVGARETLRRITVSRARST